MIEEDSYKISEPEFMEIEINKPFSEFNN